MQLNENKNKMSINTESGLLLRGPSWTSLRPAGGGAGGAASELAPPTSYWRGAAVGRVAVARVFQVLLDAVVDLQEVVVPF